MNYLITKIMLTALVFCFSNVFAQTKANLPFQVVYAENAFAGNKEEPLEQLAYLSQYEKVVLKDGFLILVHQSGKFFEYEGNVEINLVDLIQLVRKKRGAFWFGRPQVKWLFEEAYGTDFLHRPMLRYYGYSFEFDSINDNKINVMGGQPVKLSWSSGKKVKASGKYYLEFRNILDEKIASMETDTSVVEIDLEEVETESDLYLLTVYDKADRSLRSQELAIETDSPYGPISYSGTFFEKPKSAIYALELGFLFEDDLNGKLALYFYSIAAELSDRQVYQTILENFQKRAHELR
ncbi:MAG: hypothetical protein AAFQ94_11840 [Bacteroidota bacterium]